MKEIKFLMNFYRIKYWIKNIGIPILGLVVTGSYRIENFIIVILATSMVLSHSYSINNYFDHILTKENNFIGDLIKKKKMKKNIVLLLTFLPLFLILFLFPFMNIESFIFVILTAILFDLYSCPPTRLKKYPLGLLINTNCLSTFLFFHGYTLVTNVLTQRSIFLFIIIYVYLTFTSLLHEIAHSKIDKKNDLKSFPNIYGEVKAIKLAKLLLIISTIVVVSALMVNPNKNYIFIGTLFFNFARYRKISKRRINFQKIRDQVYGLEEGLYYLIILSLQNFGIIF